MAWLRMATHGTAPAGPYPRPSLRPSHHSLEMVSNGPRPASPRSLALQGHLQGGNPLPFPNHPRCRAGFPKMQKPRCPLEASRWARVVVADLAEPAACRGAGRLAGPQRGAAPSAGPSGINLGDFTWHLICSKIGDIPSTASASRAPPILMGCKDPAANPPTPPLSYMAGRIKRPENARL